MDECNAQMEMGKICERELAVRELAKIPSRSIYVCIDELANELDCLDYKIKRLKCAIDADPKEIPVSQKVLWKVQLNAMNDYKRALKNRIVNLIETDKE